jgi:hypothetical protein
MWSDYASPVSCTVTLPEVGPAKFFGGYGMTIGTEVTTVLGRKSSRALIASAD